MERYVVATRLKPGAASSPLLPNPVEAIGWDATPTIGQLPCLNQPTPPSPSRCRLPPHGVCVSAPALVGEDGEAELFEHVAVDNGTAATDLRCRNRAS
jgi:hypothetical protein